jgi:hypothetical protein
MGKLNRKEMPMWAKTGHKKPVTRREFLAAGLIPFAAQALVPGALGLLLPSPAQAAPNCSADGGSLVPFITLNLEGGAGLAANYAPRDAGMNPLTSYTKVGLGDNTGGNVLEFETEFGVPGFPKFQGNVLSRMLVGIRNNCDAATLANTAFMAVCVQSQDDSSRNKFDASGMVFRAGLAGSYIPNLGTQSTPTGVSQDAASLRPPAPLVVNSFNDIANSIGYTRALSSGNNNTAGLTGPQQNKLARLVASLSTSQAQKLNQISTVAHVKDLVECAGIKNSALVGNGSSAVSPASNQALLTRWGLNANSFTGNASSQAVVFSSMVYNALLGQSGTVNLQMGGYDYHDNTRNNGNNKDEQAGNNIGRILDSARILGKKVFLYVTSDGATVSDENPVPGQGVWRSDRGDAGLAFIFIYDPAGRPATSGYQIGNFTNGQVADNTTPVGASPELAAQAVFANYLKLNKRMDLFDRIIPRGALDAAALAKVVKVA